jgi:hypothetical protein
MQAWRCCPFMSTFLKHRKVILAKLKQTRQTQKRKQTEKEKHARVERVQIQEQKSK